MHPAREQLPTIRRPRLWLSLAITLVMVGAMAVLRLVIYRDLLVPLGFGLPLLVVLWTRDRISLWTMAGAFSAITVIKVFRVLPEEALDSRLHEWVMLGLMLVNIWAVAVVLHLVLNYRDALERANVELATANDELEASNEELSAREEEISHQNEELQSQTEELEQQSEELQSQTEELQQQAEQMQQINEELVRRERAMHALLEASASLDDHSDEQQVISNLCQVAMRVLAEAPAAASIVIRDGEDLVLRGHCGFGPAGPLRERWPVEQSLGAVVMERGQTARLDDTDLRPDLVMPERAEGGRFRSVLASPLWVGGQIVGALEIFSNTPRHWAEEDFRVSQWLAGQAGLVLESLKLKGELDDRRREAEEASQRKTRFLAAVSHDVRTPANAISLMAELIRRSAGDPAAQREIPALVRDLQSSARALVELVSDVLDLARFDSGQMDMRPARFDLCDAIQREVRQLSPLAQSKGLPLIVEGCDQPLWLFSDRMKLARVLGNLIGNAIKFTERGSVRVCCEPMDGQGIEVRIIDTGVGISAEHLPVIFDEFHQLRNPERDRTKGAGLGLAICKRLSHALGCELSVRSELDRGSMFTLHIPPACGMHPPHRHPLVEEEPDRQPGLLAALRVLLVEDHDTTRRATARLLASEGAIVAQAATGREAIHLLAHESPDVLLLDLMLPDIDGSDVLRHLQEARPASLRCVLAVSGDVTEARAAQVKCLGADALVPKPVDVEHLVRMIESRSGGVGRPDDPSSLMPRVDLP
jgi:signal transduction histidine kinase/ActR/RegA family two-component response regulator